MEKTDRSIHHICIAAIKRHTMKPYDFEFTRFYEESTGLKSLFQGMEVDLLPDELVICSTLIDGENFSVLTTRKLVTKERGNLLSGSIMGAKDKLYGDFKGNLKKEPITLGAIQLANGIDLRYFIETGRASMVMVHGVRTSIRTQGMPDEQADKIARIWTRQNNLPGKV